MSNAQSPKIVRKKQAFGVIWRYEVAVKCKSVNFVEISFFGHWTLVFGLFFPLDLTAPLPLNYKLLKMKGIVIVAGGV
jgi:hypothetical protein